MQAIILNSKQGNQIANLPSGPLYQLEEDAFHYHIPELESCTVFYESALLKCFDLFVL